MGKYKLAILTSHPIQYQAPLFKLLVAQPEIVERFIKEYNEIIKENYEK